jgi:hypothetical protein
MDLQNPYNVMSVKEAKQRLQTLGEEWEAERKARRPLATLRGKVVAGGAVAALVAGLLLSGPVKRLIQAPARVPAHPPWWRYPDRGRDVRKAATGLSLGLLFKLLKPMVPHLTRYATQRYMASRIAKARAAGKV